MHDFDSIKYREHGEQIAVITFNRPDSLNAINQDIRRELHEALQQAACDPAIRAVVLGGEGRVFSAGADLKETLGNLDMVAMLMDEYKPSFDAIIGMQKPVISAIAGSASGIGLSLALICDLTVMADDAFLLAPFSTIGLVPDGGSTFMLSRQIGYKRAFQMAIEAERLPADRALQLGLVNRLAPAELVLANAIEWATQLSQRAPAAIAHTKKLMRFAMQNNFDDTYYEEALTQKLCYASEDFKEGVSAFIEKRAPSFKGK